MRQKPKADLVKKAGQALKRASPTIMTCIGAVGVVATAVMAVKATPKALKKIEQADELKMAEKGENLTRMETIGACWTCYAPTAITGIATIGCIFSANVLNRRQQAALTSAYALLDRTFRNYKQSVKNVFGEEGHKRVMQDMAIPKTEAPRIYGCLTGKDFSFEDMPEEQYVFYDSFSERYFQATPSQVLLAEMHVNRNFALDGGEISLKSFYDLLGLDTPDDMLNLGWYVCDYYTWVDFSHMKTFIDDGIDRDPVECWIIEMSDPPTPGPLEM